MSEFSRYTTARGHMILNMQPPPNPQPLPKMQQSPRSAQPVQYSPMQTEMSRINIEELPIHQTRYMQYSSPVQQYPTPIVYNIPPQVQNQYHGERQIVNATFPRQIPQQDSPNPHAFRGHIQAPPLHVQPQQYRHPAP